MPRLLRRAIIRFASRHRTVCSAIRPTARLLSRCRFRIYYVDDSSNTNDEYTPDAVGNDANDGLSALTPKASIQAILAQYDLGAGDIILVDTGSYASTTRPSSSRPMTAARPTPAA